MKIEIYLKGGNKVVLRGQEELTYSGNKITWTPEDKNTENLMVVKHDEVQSIVVRRGWRSWL